MTADSLPDLFENAYGHCPAVIGTAPGRVEFIGNHTDYNGGLVLGAAIDRYVRVAASLRDDGAFHFTSSAGKKVVLSRQQFTPQTGKRAWINYPLGVLMELERAGMPALAGLELAVASDLPPGAGLSSSAALEMATAKALLELTEHAMPTLEAVRAARRAENDFVGVPCGILDQGVSGFGQVGHLVLIDCAVESFTPLPLSPNAHFWIINSNEKHNLVESLYAARFAECREALELIREQGITAPGLAALTPAAFAEVRERLPDVLMRRAAHVIEENARVAECRDLLQSGASLEVVGTLLDASHQSSSELFENSTPALDLLVELARKRQGVYGARLTGGGFGGAILVLADEHFAQAEADSIVEAYCVERPAAPRPSVFHVRAGAGARGEKISDPRSAEVEGSIHPM